MSDRPIRNTDCIEGMRALDDGSVDLVFADPPFNIGYKYDVYQDRMPPEEYLRWSSEWMTEVHRVLKSTGTFWLAIGDDFAAELKIEALKAGFHCRSWVIWYYTFGVNCKQKFTRSHTHLFHFVCDPKVFTFRQDDLNNRIPSARMLVYNDKRGNPRGRLPDDTWIIPPAEDSTFTLRPQDLDDCFQENEDSWYFPRVAGTFNERAGFHGCQMPEQLLGRIIRTCSEEGEVVLDPFAGSGSTLVVARKLHRFPLGFELSEEYAAAANERVESTEAGIPLVGAPEPNMSAPSTWNGKKNRATTAALKFDLKTDFRRSSEALVLKIWKQCGAPSGGASLIREGNGPPDFIQQCREAGLPTDERWLAEILDTALSGSGSVVDAESRPTPTEEGSPVGRRQRQDRKKVRKPPPTPSLFEQPLKGFDE